MNPISAIPSAAGQELTPLPLPKAQPGSPGAVTIPFREIQDLPPVLNPQPVSPASSPSHSFGHVLGRLVQEVNSKQAAASDSVRGLLSGQKVSLHQAMIAMEEASVSFQLMVEVRNKLLESYQELMRMQI